MCGTAQVAGRCWKVIDAERQGGVADLPIVVPGCSARLVAAEILLAALPNGTGEEGGQRKRLAAGL